MMSFVVVLVLFSICWDICFGEPWNYTEPDPDPECSLEIMWNKTGQRVCVFTDIYVNAYETTKAWKVFKCSENNQLTLNKLCPASCVYLYGTAICQDDLDSCPSVGCACAFENRYKCVKSDGYGSKDATSWSCNSEGMIVRHKKCPKDTTISGNKCASDGRCASDVSMSGQQIVFLVVGIMMLYALGPFAITICIVCAVAQLIVSCICVASVRFQADGDAEVTLAIKALPERQQDPDSEKRDGSCGTIMKNFLALLLIEFRSVISLYLVLVNVVGGFKPQPPNTDRVTNFDKWLMVDQNCPCTKTMFKSNSSNLEPCQECWDGVDTCRTTIKTIDASWSHFDLWGYLYSGGVIVMLVVSVGIVWLRLVSRIVWIHSHIVRTLEFIVFNSMYQESIVYRVAMSVVWIVLMITLFLYGFGMNFGFQVSESNASGEVDYNSILINSFLRIGLTELIMLYELYRVLTFRGTANFNFVKTLSRSGVNLPDINVGVFKLIRSDLDTILHEFIVALSVIRREPNKKKKLEELQYNIGIYSHIKFSYLKHMSESDLDLVKSYTINPFIGNMIPYIAVVTANVVNINLTCKEMLNDGVDVMAVVDGERTDVKCGKSRIAGRRALAKCLTSRILHATFTMCGSLFTYEVGLRRMMNRTGRMKFCFHHTQGGTGMTWGPLAANLLITFFFQQLGTPVVYSLEQSKKELSHDKLEKQFEDVKVNGKKVESFWFKTGN